MLNEPVKTRFAPSPTGYLHLGNVRTALFNALLARKLGGTLVLRIEDTDRSRSHVDYQQALQEDLRWLDLIWQEGPEADAPLGPYLQSQRGDIYRHQYDALIEGRYAYPCFCSEQELKQVRKAQIAAGRPPRYPGTCAELNQDEIERKLRQDLRPSLRFRVPKDETVQFEDLVRGRQQCRTSDIGDFVIRRSDLTPAFFFSNAVDDALMRITHVLRGEDHLANTPRQLLVLRALKYKAPVYGHIAMLLGADGSPLSKRRGAKSVRGLREAGYLPQAVNNYLARLGHVYAQTGFLSPEALVNGFDLSRLGRAPARFDESQLRYWQKEAIAVASDEMIWDWLTSHYYRDDQHIESLVPEEHRLNFVRAIRDNIELPIDGFVIAGNVFQQLPTYSTQAQAIIHAAGRNFFQLALSSLPATAADFRAYAQPLGKAAGVKGKALFMPLRAALTGEIHGPELARMFPLIGIERARARLEAVIEIASD
jgi:nondiscriminating glutamyl-tRNA synthetase